MKKHPERVYKSITLPIKNLSKEDIDYLYECNRESARVWNECVRLNKELWEIEQRHVDRNYLQTKTKGFSKVLTAKGIQMTCYKYLMAVTSIQKARKNGRTDMKYPWRKKKYMNTRWDIQNLQINYDKGVIRIPRPRKVVNHKYVEKPIFLKFKSESIPENIAQVELIYNNGLQLAINYYMEEENIQIQSENICAVDMGEIHSITAIDLNGNNTIITGRKIRSSQRFRNKELTKLNRKLSKCKKDSRNYKKYRSAIRKLLSKSTNIMRNNINKTAKLFTDYVIENNIGIVVIGDLKHFNKNLRQRKQSKGRYQKIVQWVHGQIQKKIEYNLSKYGVTVTTKTERYSSQTCPACGHRYKPTGRNYICSECGFIGHRDIVGAMGILSNYLYNEIKGLNIDIKPIKYLRIA